MSAPTAPIPSLHGDLGAAIGAQVEQMILQAKKDSEARVRHELNVARSQLQQMEALITDLTDRVGSISRTNGNAAAETSLIVDRTFLSAKVSQLEQKWGSEVKALKQDLHRTILAHNHNSDLMRHHRDALDEARRKMDSLGQPKAEQVDAQIQKIERLLRAGEAKQRALDALTERIVTLELQVNEMLPGTAMANPFASMMQGLAVPGETRSSKKDSEPPSEEEVRKRLLQAAKAAQGDASTTFNAEAPVFIPRGVAQDVGPSSVGEASSPGEDEGEPSPKSSGPEGDK
jgi:uncharacterized membrane protein YccC